MLASLTSSQKMINGYTSSQCMACNRSRVLVARNAHGRILGTPHQRLTGVRTKAVIENHQGIQQIIQYSQIEKQSQPGISLIDITRDIRDIIATAGLRDGVVNILSRHTTTAVTINEAETRLMDDIRQWLRKLAPPGEPYLHNDLHVREAPPGWPGGHAAWVKQEPVNAHAHLLSIMIGNTLSVPVVEGKLCLGTWQSVLLVDLDGPRLRTVGVQIMGQRHAPSS